MTDAGRAPDPEARAGARAQVAQDARAGDERAPDDPDAASEVALVQRKAARMRRARRSLTSPWRHLAQVGVLGWLFVVPVLLLLWLGRLLAHATGIRLLAVAGLLAGVALGAYLVSRSVRRSLEQGAAEDSEPGEQGKGQE